MKLHILCSAFPEMNPEEFSELVTNMKTKGFKKDEPIITHKGEILDGQNRYNAAQAAGVKPIFKKFEGKESELIDFVERKNIFRRHLNVSQRAMIAAAFTEMRNAPLTTEQAAKKTGVSTDSVNVAKKISKKSKKLAKEVKDGKKTLNQAERQITKGRSEGPRDYSGVYSSGKASDKPEEPKDPRKPDQIAYEAYAVYMQDETKWDDLLTQNRTAWAIVINTLKGKI